MVELGGGDRGQVGLGWALLAWGGTHLQDDTNP